MSAFDPKRTSVIVDSYNEAAMNSLGLVQTARKFISYKVATN
jgi:hypothetical protein